MNPNSKSHSTVRPWPYRKGTHINLQKVYQISVKPTQLLVGVSNPNKKLTLVLKKGTSANHIICSEKDKIASEISIPHHLQGFFFFFSALFYQQFR